MNLVLHDSLNLIENVGPEGIVELVTTSSILSHPNDTILSQSVPFVAEKILHLTKFSW